MPKLLLWCTRLVRILILIVLVGVGTTLLVRLSPGYFSDAREMDAQYAHTAEAELKNEHGQAATVSIIGLRLARGWLHGDLGRSRQYDVPVVDLLRSRIASSAWLLARALLYSWIIAGIAAAITNLAPRSSALLNIPFTLLLALPVGALATLCMVSENGSPVLVLTVLLAARDFKFVSSIVRRALRDSCLLQAVAQGMRLNRILCVHLIPRILAQVVALAVFSFVTALSALVPVEVIFDVPGVGQLAWNAAMNRDIPVMLAVTLLMATMVAITGHIYVDDPRTQGAPV